MKSFTLFATLFSLITLVVAASPPMTSAPAVFTEPTADCSDTVIYDNGATHTFKVCIEGQTAPYGCEYRSTSILSQSYLTCQPSCIILHGTGAIISTFTTMNTCPYSITNTPGCTKTNDQVYCPPSEYCSTSSTLISYGGGFYLAGLMAVECKTDICSFTTSSDIVGYDCAPYTTSLDNGCQEIIQMEDGSVVTSTICETESTPPPSSLINCTTGSYFPSHTNPDDYTEYTLCPDTVTLPAGCKTTDWPYFSGEVAVTCNPPCTMTETTGEVTYTVSYNYCPTSYDSGTTPELVYTTTTEYDGSCATYDGYMTCPDHCIITTFSRYEGATCFLTESHSCDPTLSCLFVGYLGPSPSFSCVYVSTVPPVTPVTCTTKTYTTVTTIVKTATFCEPEVSIPPLCPPLYSLATNGHYIGTCVRPCQRTSTFDGTTKVVSYSVCPL